MDYDVLGDPRNRVFSWAGRWDGMPANFCLTFRKGIFLICIQQLYLHCVFELKCFWKQILMLVWCFASILQNLGLVFGFDKWVGLRHFDIKESVKVIYGID